MSGISQIVHRVVGGGRGATGGMTRRRGAAMPARGRGRSTTRTQDEAIGRGVRGLLRRVR